MIVLLITIAVFVVLGILFINGKAAFLIAGYNTMSPQDKAQYDIAALSKFMGKIMFVTSASLAMIALGEMLSSTGLIIVGTVVLIAASLFAAVYANTSNRFKIDTTEQ